MAVGKPIPCAGFASQTDAIEAFMAEGLDRNAIVQRTGLKFGRVDTLMSHNRKRIAARAHEAATWSPEKISKAQRLFGATMALIAQALDVPVTDLIRKVAPWSPEALELLKAPSADAQAAIDADNEEQELIELGAAAPETVPERPAVVPADALTSGAAEGNGADLVAPESSPSLTFFEVGDTTVPPYEAGACLAVVEPSREDDEAELAALEAAESADPVANVGEGANGAIAAASDDPASRDADVAQHQALAVSGFSGAAAGGGESFSPPAALTAPSGAPLFRLKRRGEYLDKSGVGTTRNLRRAWQGTAPQMETIYRRRPEYLDFDAEPVHA